MPYLTTGRISRVLHTFIVIQFSSSILETVFYLLLFSTNNLLLIYSFCFLFSILPSRLHLPPSRTFFLFILFIFVSLTLQAFVISRFFISKAQEGLSVDCGRVAIVCNLSFSCLSEYIYVCVTLASGKKCKSVRDPYAGLY